MKTDDPLTAFFYDLMRDHLPMGVINKMLRESIEVSDDDSNFELSDGYLAEKAHAVAQLFHNHRDKQVRSGDKPTWMCWEMPAGILCPCGEVHRLGDFEDHLRTCETGQKHYAKMIKRLNIASRSE